MVDIYIQSIAGYNPNGGGGSRADLISGLMFK